MNAMDRFIGITIEERDIFDGHLEEQMIETITYALNKRSSLPPVAIIFPVCLHKFLSVDLDYVYKKLRATFPTVVFVEAYMDPLSQKEGLAPDQRLRKVMYDSIQPLAHDDSIALLGSEVTHTYETSDLVAMARDHHLKVRQLKDISYQDFLDLGHAKMHICTYPAGDYGIQALSNRLDASYLYLSPCFDYKSIQEELDLFCDKLHISHLDHQTREGACEEAFSHLKDIIGQKAIAIDFVATPRPLNLARVLLEHGFNVTSVYLDTIFPEEKEDFFLLQKQFPDLKLIPTIHANMRFEMGEGECLAIGPKAAYFENTRHFVNIIEGGGFFGYRGLLSMLKAIEEAYYASKDPALIVPQKGLGCECLL
ncbi:MAG TPA: nitrogenase [Erysipelotrichaceae bacterium]|nr:nitrogenase [Erysipelotrichaceae bacterium]